MCRHGAIWDRLVRMYERDKCHPCIIVWSLGNEAGYGPVHDALAAYVRGRERDPATGKPGRPVQYEGGGSQTPATDIICPMYPTPAQMERESLSMQKHWDGARYRKIWALPV